MSEAADDRAWFERAGLREVEVLSRSDYFSGSRDPETLQVAGSFKAHTVVLRARRQ